MNKQICLIRLYNEKCKINFITYSLDLIMMLVYNLNGQITSNKIQELIREKINNCPHHIEITEKDMIDKLFNYDCSYIDMEDSDIILFIEEYGKHFDVTLKWHGQKNIEENSNR